MSLDKDLNQEFTILVEVERYSEE